MKAALRRVVRFESVGLGKHRRLTGGISNHYLLS